MHVCVGLGWDQLWLYDDGIVTHVGVGHSAPITGVAISPDKMTIVSISSDGAIHCWKFPQPRIPTPDVTASTANMVEAQFGPIYDDEGDPKLVPDDVAKEFIPMLETKAGAIMPTHEECTLPQL